MQKQVKIEGTVAACRGCGRQPKVYNCLGPGTYFLECSVCGVRTAKHPALQLALEDWETGERVQLLVAAGAR